jgi:O-antigen/teichoic acid export membrane protein
METPEDVLAPPPQGVQGRVIRKNLAVVSLAYLVGSLSGFFALAYLARKLGDATFGTYVAATALVNIVGVVDNLGGGIYLVREAARDPTRLPGLLGDVLVLKTAANLLVTGISVAAAALLGFGGSEIVVVAILALMFGANAISKAVRAGLQTLERMEVAAAITMGNAAISAAGMIAVVAAGGGLVAAVAVSTAVSLLTIPVGWVALRRRVRFRLRTSWATLRSLTVASLPFAIAGVFTFATTYADALVIKGVLGNRQTGLYGAATRIVLILQSIPSIYLDSVYRTISHLTKAGMEALGDFVDRSSAWLCLLALPFAAGGMVVGDRVLTLVFGAAFAPAAGAFRILLWSLVPGFPGWILMPTVLADRPRAAARIVGAGFVLNVGLNLVLVPLYGIAAAAWLTVLASAFTSVVPTIVLARHGMRVRWPLLSLPGVAAAAVMALSIYPLRHAPLIVPIVVGGLVYAAGLLLTGTPRRLGVRWEDVRRVLRRRERTRDSGVT